MFERTKGTMEGALGKAAHFFGPVGSGSRMKLVVNMTMGTMMNSLVRTKSYERRNARADRASVLPLGKSRYARYLSGRDGCETGISTASRIWRAGLV